MAISSNPLSSSGLTQRVLGISLGHTQRQAAPYDKLWAPWPTLEGDEPLDLEPADVRAAFDRAMAMLFIMTGRLRYSDL